MLFPEIARENVFFLPFFFLFLRLFFWSRLTFECRVKNAIKWAKWFQYLFTNTNDIFSSSLLFGKVLMDWELTHELSLFFVCLFLVSRKAFDVRRTEIKCIFVVCWKIWRRAIFDWNEIMLVFFGANLVRCSDWSKCK